LDHGESVSTGGISSDKRKVRSRML